MSHLGDNLNKKVPRRRESQHSLRGPFGLSTFKLPPSLDLEPYHLKLGLRRADTLGGEKNTRDISARKKSDMDENFSIADSSRPNSDNSKITDGKKSKAGSESSESSESSITISPIKVVSKSIFKNFGSITMAKPTIKLSSNPSSGKSTPDEFPSTSLSNTN